MGNVILIGDHEGPLVTWRDPEPGALYVIGVDPTLARDPRKESDHCCISVWRRWPHLLEQVAELYDRIQPNIAGRTAALMGFHYNTALINVERNIMEGVLLGLRAKEYPEEQFYLHRRLKSSTGQMEEALFFNKSIQSEAELFETMIELADTGCLTIRSKELHDEFEGLRETLTRTGRPHVETNGKDRVVAALMAMVAHRNWAFNPEDAGASAADEQPPWGVDPNAWREKRNLKKPREDWGDLGGIPKFS